MKNYFKVAGVSVLIAGFTLTGCRKTEPFNLNNNVVEKGLDGRSQVSEKLTLDASKEHKLNGSFIVKSGAELIIPAGTKIIAEKGGTNVFIAVLKGGKITINGTQDNPVVMGSNNPQPGDWGGLTICGKATTTAGVDAGAEVGGFNYGGDDDGDNSGVIKNLVVKGSGAQINSESQYNGVSFYAVGSGTIVENLAVIGGQDDGVEFFGGSVNVKNLYLVNNEDDSIDWTEGWNGKITNAYIEHNKGDFSTAFEGDGENKNPKFENVTAICTADTNKKVALQFKKKSGATITNLYLKGYDQAKIVDMKDKGGLGNVQIEGKDAVNEDIYPKDKMDTSKKIDISSWKWYKK